MKDKESYYLVPGAQALVLLGELKEMQDTAAYLMKHYAEVYAVDDWEQSPVPQLSEIYSGARACASLLRTLMDQPTPPEVKHKVTGDGFCITAMQYLEFVTMIESLRDLRKQASSTNNISFEIH
mgnify:CR=1 FL=1